jgi:outer membrane receptor protein involved in Fe transport
MGAGEWALSGVWAFSDDYWFDIFNTLEQPSYNVLNLRLGYEANSGRWGVAAFADNVTDEEYYASRFVFLDVANRRAPGRLMRVEFTAYF